MVKEHSEQTRNLGGSPNERDEIAATGRRRIETGYGTREERNTWAQVGQTGACRETPGRSERKKGSLCPREKKAVIMIEASKSR